jgi:hypothetical protein
MVAIYEHCPYCGMRGKATSPLDEIYMARRTCEGCGKEFLIVNNKPVKPEDYSRSA